MKDFNEILQKIKTLIDNDKTILQNTEFIKFMNKFGFKYDGHNVSIDNNKNK
jgi:hypothetical protein